MGILNVTPDSFWDPGRYCDPRRALSRALAMQDQGADLLDIGAESTRPGSMPVSAGEELRRLLPVLEKVIPKLSLSVCVDTTKAEVAARSIALGARMINDTNALSDPAMAGVVAKAKAGIILMHRKGPSATMQRKPAYRHCVREIAGHLALRAQKALTAGISRKRIFIDPGLGFGKALKNNLEILKDIQSLRALGYPVVLGLSRKSFLGLLLDAPVEQRLAGSLAAACVAAMRGVSILRVHDVRETVHAMKVLEALGAL